MLKTDAPIRAAVDVAAAAPRIASFFFSFPAFGYARWSNDNGLAELC
jgi:hypothetical protein